MSGPSRALARRYARALLEVASPQGRDGVLGLRDELTGFVRQLAAHPELQQALAHPALKTEQKQRLVARLAESAQVSPLVVRLLRLLGGRDRLSLLGEVAELYGALANAAHGIVAAEVVSATPLAAAQRAALQAALKGRAASVELEERVDPAVVGGLVVTALGRTYDGSVRARLAALRRRLATAG